MPETKLVFVYNADSGIFNAILDSAHKLIRPSTYSCSLCALTYHTFGEKNQWKQFRNDIGIPMEFLHKDEFEKIYPDNNIQLPAVLVSNNKDLTVLIDKEELDSFKDLHGLINQLTLKLETNSNT